MDLPIAGHASPLATTTEMEGAEPDLRTASVELLKSQPHCLQGIRDSATAIAPASEQAVPQFTVILDPGQGAIVCP